MIKKFIQVVIIVALTIPAHAEEGTNQETDSQVIIEHPGGDDTVKPAKAPEGVLKREEDLKPVLPAHAGQGTIQETDTQIIIEYSGGDDDVKAAKAREEELESQRRAEQATNNKKEEEEALHQQRMEKAKRKGALRGVITE